MKDLRVNTPFGKATVTEDMGDSVQVKLDLPHKDGNREYFLCVLYKAEVDIIPFDNLNRVEYMEVHRITTNLKGLKRWAWQKNLEGFFSVDGISLTDKQVRKVVDWAIDKGYEYDSDIPSDEVIKLLNLKHS